MKKIVGWNAAILLVGLLGGELIFGSWLKGGGLGTVHVPRDLNLQHDVSEIRPDGGIVRYSRDRWGLRGSHQSAAAIDILAIGGSTTDELYSDDSETWTFQLEQKFRQAGIPITVGNAGINGHSTIGHIYSLENWLLRVPNLQPKIILFYIGINDAVLPADGSYDAIVPANGWGKFRRYAINNSAVIRLIRVVRGSILASELRLAYRAWAPTPLKPVAPPAIHRKPYIKRLSTYRQRVLRLIQLAVERGATPILVTQRRGDAHSRNGILFARSAEAAKVHELQRLFNQEMLSACRSKGAVCVDLASEINLTYQDFFDSMHTNPAGSEKIAEYLFSVLKPLTAPVNLDGKPHADSRSSHR